MESGSNVLFQGINGSLQLVVEGYQFPAVTDDWWDANWLVVQGNAGVNGNSWSFRDACLTTFELERLASWLDEAANRKEAPTFCGFTEPNLGFRLAPNRAVSVALSLGALPPWADKSAEVVVVDIPSDLRLAHLTADLRKILTKFQVRARGSSNAT